MTRAWWTASPRIGLTVLLLLLPGAASAESLRVSFVADGTPSTLEVGQPDCVPIALRNDGTVSWRRSASFRLAYHWVDRQGTVVVGDGERTELPRDVEPGQTVLLCADVVPPDAAGSYQLQWDMVQDGVTWFSSGNPANALLRTVTVSPARPIRAGQRAVLTALLFWLLTLAPLALTACWLRAWYGPDIATRDEFIFHTVVFGLGQLYVVLHVLVFTSGLSLWRVGVCVAALHAGLAIAWWRTRNRRGATAAAAPVRASRGVTILELVSGSVIGGIFIDWAWTASRSLQVVGTDAAHYHVPHALDFVRGVNPFVFLATSHMYPMGTSLWAAWFSLPFDDPLLLELATAPAFLLLLASCCLLFRILTGRSGLAWTPWVVLLAFTEPLPSLTMLMSADLAYAAAFVALLTQVLLIRSTRRLDSRQMLAVGLCAGVLLSTKSTGLASAVCIGLLFAWVVRTIPRNGERSGLRPSAMLTAAALVMATGGLWLVRNWWLFGSPVAPFGLSIGAFRIFPGQSPSVMRYYLSVMGDLRQQPDYPLLSRFSEAVRAMYGAWVFPAAALSGLLVADVAWQRARRQPLNQETRAKLFFFGFFVVAFAAHAVLLADLPWTSLEWTRRLSLRYLLPFYPLWVIGLYSLAFMGAPTWRGARNLGAIAAAVLVPGALWYYRTHLSTPELPPDETIGALRAIPVAVSAAILVAAVAPLAGWHRTVGRLGAATLGAAALIALAWHGVVDHERVLRDRERDASREAQSLRVGFAPLFPHRGLYLRVKEFQQTASVSCRRTTFFLASRFDLPLDLQDADYQNVVVDIGNSRRAAAEQLAQGQRGCDIVVAIRSDMAGNPATLDGLFARSGQEQIAEYGIFAAYTKR